MATDGWDAVSGGQHRSQRDASEGLDGLTELFGDDETPAPDLEVSHAAEAGLADVFGDVDGVASGTPVATDAPVDDLADLFGDDLGDGAAPPDGGEAGAPSAAVPSEKIPAVPAADAWLVGDDAAPAPADASDWLSDSVVEAPAPTAADGDSADAPAPEPDAADGASEEQAASSDEGDVDAATEAEPDVDEVVSGTDDNADDNADDRAAGEAPETPTAEPDADESGGAPEAGEAGLGKRPNRLADMRARQQAASDDAFDSAQHLAVADDNTWDRQRWDNAEAFFMHVDRILGYVATQHDLQTALRDINITRDAYLDQMQRAKVEELIRPRLIDAAVTMSPREIPIVFSLLYDEWTGISALGPLWRDDDVTEIMVDGWNRIVVERAGRLELTPAKFRSAQHAMEVARNLSQKVSDRPVTESNPIVTSELPGARLHFCVGKVVKSGLSISIRKFVPLMDMDKLLSFGAMSDEMADFLRDAVGKGRANIIVSGGTGSGKTTMLNAVSGFIPRNERVVTIEDAFELSLQNELVVSLQTKEAGNADGKTANIDMAALLRSSLRMRPDRVVVGEIRGPEAQVMLQAANTGHDGTMSTLHANSAEAAVNFRLPDMLLMAREMPIDVARRQVAAALDLVVQVTRRAGRRFVSEIAAVDLSCIDEHGTVAPHMLFEGDLDADGSPVFRRVGSVRPDTDLAIKLVDHGGDVDRWVDGEEGDR